jgi:hypothetical protein
MGFLQSDAATGRIASGEATRPLALLAAVWGVTGVLAIIGFAVYRLAPVGLAAFEGSFGIFEWTVFALWMVFMVYSEGYRGFHRAFAPRVVARARALAARPRPVPGFLAPFFCFGFFHATRKRMIVSWSVAAGIVGLVLLVRLLPQPWRGIVDCGVVAGLLLGMGSILYYAARWAVGRPYDYPADLPAVAQAAR